LRCELCGNKIEGAVHHVIVEGSRMTVCSDCSRFGSGEWKPEPPKPRKAVKASGTALTPRQGPSGDMAREEGLRVVPDYSQVIRRGRERMGLSIEELSSKAGLKASQMRKVEAGKLVLSLREARLLGHILRVSLITEEAPAKPQVRGQRLPELTLGDVVEVRRGE